MVSILFIDRKLSQEWHDSFQLDLPSRQWLMPVSVEQCEKQECSGKRRQSKEMDTQWVSCHWMDLAGKKHVRAGVDSRHLGMKRQKKSLSSACQSSLKMYRTTTHLSTTTHTPARDKTTTSLLNYLSNECIYTVRTIHPDFHCWTSVIWAIGITWEWVIGNGWILRKEKTHEKTYFKLKVESQWSLQ